MAIPQRPQGLARGRSSAMIGMVALLLPVRRQRAGRAWYGVGRAAGRVAGAVRASTCRWWTPHPKRTLVLPLVAVVVWFAVLSAGGRCFDWTRLSRLLRADPQDHVVAAAVVGGDEQVAVRGAGDRAGAGRTAAAPRGTRTSLQLAGGVEGQEQHPAGLEAGDRERAVEGAPLVAVDEACRRRSRGSGCRSSTWPRSGCRAATGRSSGPTRCSRAPGSSRSRRR